MENATKALLIAAGVLVTIVIVSIGILLIQNASNTSEDAQNVANAIDKATGNASSDAIGGLKQTIISKKKFNSVIKKSVSGEFKTSSEFQTALLKQNDILSDQITIEGYVYLGGNYDYWWSVEPYKSNLKWKDYDDFHADKNKKYMYYEIHTLIPDLMKKGLIIKLNEPINDEDKQAYKEILNYYNKNLGKNLTYDEFKENVAKGNAWDRWALEYDQWGYICKAVYVAHVNYEGLKY